MGLMKSVNQSFKDHGWGSKNIRRGSNAQPSLSRIQESVYADQREKLPIAAAGWGSAIGELEGEPAAGELMITDSAPGYPTKSLHQY